MVTRPALNVSLFDVEDLTETIKVRDMHVGSVSTKEVTEFCRRYHYTATGGNMTWRYGLWHGPTLLGVVAYNLPTRDVCLSPFGFEHGPNHVWHMGRLVLPDHVPRNSESRLIGGSLQAIERDRPDIWGVVTYAAPDQGHVGYVYQATNALYTGTAGRVAYNSSYVDREGRLHSAAYGGHYVDRARGEAMGWEPVAGQAKHRYLYILGNRRERRARLAQLRWPILPYPKALL